MLAEGQRTTDRRTDRQHDTQLENIMHSPVVVGGRHKNNKGSLILVKKPIINNRVRKLLFVRQSTTGGRLSRPIGTAVRVHNPCPRLYIAVTVVINTTGRDEIRTWVSHYSVPNYHCMADLHKGGGYNQGYLATMKMNKS